ncbi:MAG: hypothetical protein MUF78_07285 [Candidatus Edwardsbacteria bacterium]|jgi:hypothetical protein|nr:hypothetical protein [Candidatus Edwardsbacteria bacterium]
MTTEEAFLLINNLDYETEYRDTARRWSTVVVNERGAIVGVIRHDSEPTEELGRKHLMMYPGTVQFEAWPGKYATKDDLAREVENARKTAGRDSDSQQRTVD